MDGGMIIAEAKLVKVSDVVDIREVFLERALSAPVLPPYQQGNGGSCPC